MSDTIKIEAARATTFGGLKDSVTVEMQSAGITLIRGKHGSGKTSLLNAIATNLGGKKLAPSLPVHAGAAKAECEVKLSNGLRVKSTVSAKTGILSIVITDDNTPGMRATGRALLDKAVSMFALNAPAFNSARPQVRRDMFLAAAGVDVSEFDAVYSEAYDLRRDLAREEGRLKTLLESTPRPAAGLPTEPVSAADLIARIQQAHKAATKADRLKEAPLRHARLVADAKSTVKEAEDRLAIERRRLADAEDRLREAQDALAFVPPAPDPAALEEELATIEQRNADIRTAAEYRRNTEALSGIVRDRREAQEHMDQVAARKQAALDHSTVGITGLSIDPDSNDLALNGVPWDSLGATERFKIAVQIVRHDNPACGFVLWDGIESAGDEGIAELDAIARAKGLQLIGTCVGRGDGGDAIILEGGRMIKAEVQDV